MNVITKFIKRMVRLVILFTILGTVGFVGLTHVSYVTDIDVEKYSVFRKASISVPARIIYVDNRTNTVGIEVQLDWFIKFDFDVRMGKTTIT